MNSNTEHQAASRAAQEFSDRVLAGLANPDQLGQLRQCEGCGKYLMVTAWTLGLHICAVTA